MRRLEVKEYSKYEDYLKSVGSNYQKFRKIYQGMKQRCSDPNAINYKYYGGRGISLEVELPDFLIWVCKNIGEYISKNGNPLKISVNRLDHSKNYCLENMELISLKENISESNERRERNFDFAKLLTIYSIQNRYLLSREYQVSDEALSSIRSGKVYKPFYKLCH